MPSGDDDARLDRFAHDLRQEIQASAAHVVAVLGERLDGVEARLDQRIDGVEARLNGVEGRLDGVEGRLDGVDVRLEAVDARFDRLEQRIEAGEIETRRHFDVVAEAMMSKLALLAEGFVLLGEKIDRFRDDVTGEFRAVERRLVRLEARVLPGAGAEGA